MMFACSIYRGQIFSILPIHLSSFFALFSIEEINRYGSIIGQLYPWLLFEFEQLEAFLENQKAGEREQDMNSPGFLHAGLSPFGYVPLPKLTAPVLMTSYNYSQALCIPPFVPSCFRVLIASCCCQPLRNPSWFPLNQSNSYSIRKYPFSKLP